MNLLCVFLGVPRNSHCSHRYANFWNFRAPEWPQKSQTNRKMIGREELLFSTKWCECLMIVSALWKLWSWAEVPVLLLGGIRFLHSRAAHFFITHRLHHICQTVSENTLAGDSGNFSPKPYRDFPVKEGYVNWSIIKLHNPLTLIWTMLLIIQLYLKVLLDYYKL